VNDRLEESPPLLPAQESAGVAIDPDPLLHTATAGDALAEHGSGALVMTSVFLGFLAIAAALPVVPVYARTAFHAGDIAIGMVMGVQALVAVLSRPLAGRIGPRCGWRLILQIGLSTLTIGTACYLIPFGLSGLTIARIICGVGEAMVLTAGGAWMVARAHETRRGRVLGLFGLAMWGGMAIGPVLGDFASRHAGVPAVWILGVILGVAGVVVISLSRDAGCEETMHPPQHGFVPACVIAPGLVMTLATIGYSAIATFLSLHLRARGLSSGPEVYAVFGLAFVGSRGLFGGIVDKAGAARVAAVAAIGAASGLAILAISHSTFIAVIGAAIGGGCFSMIYPSMAVIAIRGVPSSDRGTAIGAFTTSYDLGLLIGSPLLGVVASHGGYPAAFFFAAISSLAAAVGAAIFVFRELKLRRISP
jgi:MFS family permease